MTMTSDSVGPVTRGPSPTANGPSVASRRRPSLTVFPATVKSRLATNSATVVVVSTGGVRTIPSGRRMSSPWMTTSPSHAAFGPHVDVVLSCTARKRARVSAGVAPRCSARRRSLCRSKSTRAPRTLRTQRHGPMLAAAVRWATVSSTVHRSDSDVVAHCASVSPARSSASAARSTWVAA